MSCSRTPKPMNCGMIATGNHSDSNSLRVAPPSQALPGAHLVAAMRRI